MLRGFGRSVYLCSFLWDLYRNLRNLPSPADLILGLVVYRFSTTSSCFRQTPKYQGLNHSPKSAISILPIPCHKETYLDVVLCIGPLLQDLELVGD